MKLPTINLYEAIEAKLLEQRFRLDAILVADAHCEASERAHPPASGEAPAGFAIQRVALRADGAFEVAALGDDVTSCGAASGERRALLLRDPALIEPALAAMMLGLPEAIAVPDGEESWRSTRALFDAGYLRCGTANAADEIFICYLRSNLVRYPDRLAGASRGVAAMSRLGSNGRFANQLFQYAFLELYALRHELSIAVPTWDGCGLFGLNDPEPDLETLLRLSFYAFDDDDLALWEAESPPIDIDFDGYFQELPPCWAPHRAFLRRLFGFGPDKARSLDDWAERLTVSGERRLVAIHIRRGDYPDLHAQGLGWYRPIPLEWYRAWLTGLQHTLGDFALYVATDAPDEVVSYFADFAPTTAADLPSGSDIPVHVVDFEMLRRATHIAVVNSSFSRMAAILAADSQTAVLADFASESFKTYDSWTDRRFWERFAPPGAAVQAFGSSPEATRQRSLKTRLELSNSRKSTHALVKQAVDHHKQIADYKAYVAEKDRYIEDLVEQVSVSETLHAANGALRTENETLRKADGERLRTLASTRFALQGAAVQIKALEAHQMALAQERDIAVSAHDSAATAYHAAASAYHAAAEANLDKDQALQAALFLASPAGVARRLAFRPVLAALAVARKVASALGLPIITKLQDDERLLRERRYRQWAGLMRRRAMRLWSKDRPTSDVADVDLQHGPSDLEPTAPRAQHVTELMDAAVSPPPSYDAALGSVVVVVPWLVQGGSEVVLFDVLDALRHRVNLAIVTTLAADHTMTEAFRQLAREIHHLGGKLEDDEAVAFLTALCRTRNAGLILSSNASLIYLQGARLKADDPRRKIFDILHNDLREGHFASAVAATASIDRHIVVAEQISEALQSKGVSGERITVIQNGIDIGGTFDPSRTPTGEGRRFLGCGDDDFVVGYIGRMSAEKRPMAFLDIVEQLPEIPNLRVVMIGSGPLDAEVDARLKTLTQTFAWRRHLDRSDMNKVYAALDVLVLPSTIEGMPLVVLEAMAMGVPVAVTDVGSIRRIVDDGVSGFIVGVDHYLDLARAIADLAADPQRCVAMGSAARESIIAKGLSRQVMRDSYVELVEANLRPRT